MNRNATYSIRQGHTADRIEVADMIRARVAWMRSRGHRRWAGWERNADELAAQLGDPRWPTWVLGDVDNGIVGITTAAHDTPLMGWSEHERAQSAMFLQSTVTDPRYSGRGLGILIVFWALDYAALQGYEWVRRGVQTIGEDNRGLLRYYRGRAGGSYGPAHTRAVGRSPCGRCSVPHNGNLGSTAL